MRISKLWTVLIISGMLAGAARAEDKTMAAALAQAAAKLASDGKNEKARDMCFKALANDENCPEALYEISKLFEKDGDMVTAADFSVRAARELARQEAANPAFSAKRNDAELRIKRLNPHAARFTTIMTEYAQDLGNIAKKNNDSFTLDEAADRVSMLKLASIVPPEKMPSIERPAPKTTAAKTTKSTDDSSTHYFSGRKPKDVVTNVPLDVERALKADGWETITGTWKKVRDKVYDVTDGKLEATKTNGAVQVVASRTAKIKVFVRNAQREEYYSSSYANGYGLQLASNGIKVWSATNGYFSSNQAFKPYLERTLPYSTDRLQLLVTILDGKLEMYVNGKREHNSNYKLCRDGNFIIEVEGNAIIEVPQTKGQ